MSEAAFYHISQETGLKQISSIDEAIKKTGQGGYMWFDFDNPTIEQISPVIEPLGIHPLSIEDCFDDNQVPKIDLFPKHSFFLFNNYSYDKKLFSVDEIDFVLSSNYLLTVHGYKAADKDFFNKLRAYVVSGASKSNLSSGPDFLMHLILDFIVDHKFDAIEMLQEELDEKEEIILNGE
ncbi:hypothetical protein HYY75_06755, partial [bacterium]|nr:hypothetical protein [bacterium]